MNEEQTNEPTKAEARAAAPDTPDTGAPPLDVPQPTVGRIVLYRLEFGPHAGEDRPAMVVANRDGRVNLSVFLDGPNDAESPPPNYPHVYLVVMWRGTVPYGRERGHWRWPDGVRS